MKKVLMILTVCGLYAPAFAQQVSINELKNAANNEQLSVPAIAAPSAAVPEKNEIKKPIADKAEMPRREVKFRLGIPATNKSGNCSVTAQDGTLDSWACRNSDGKIRCYADVNVDGKTFRVNGGCAASYSDCWWSGSAAVKDPCDSIDVNPDPAPGSGCTVKDQDGTLDSWACRDSEGKMRCYADVTANGSSFRVYGGCFASFSDCWSTGPGAVNPCD
ncbi:MAG: hypothetical protein NTX59_12075 [Elusimicrobia bacterium]|nr:hypothetical protein [Elusimicrobiota bacterium]